MFVGNRRNKKEEEGIMKGNAHFSIYNYSFLFCLPLVLHSNGFNFLECSELFFTPYGVSRVCGRCERRW